MATTFKRLNISLTFEDMRLLDELCAIFRENPTPTIRRCIEAMHSNVTKTLELGLMDSEQKESEK
jgi:hypothetical protein